MGLDYVWGGKDGYIMIPWQFSALFLWHAQSLLFCYSVICHSWMILGRWNSSILKRPAFYLFVDLRPVFWAPTLWQVLSEEPQADKSPPEWNFHPGRRSQQINVIPDFNPCHEENKQVMSQKETDWQGAHLANVLRKATLKRWDLEWELSWWKKAYSGPILQIRHGGFE